MSAANIARFLGRHLVNADHKVEADGDDEDTNSTKLKVLVDPDAQKLVAKTYQQYVSDSDLSDVVSFTLDFDRLLAKYRQGKPLSDEEIAKAEKDMEGSDDADSGQAEQEELDNSDASDESDDDADASFDADADNEDEGDDAENIDEALNSDDDDEDANELDEDEDGTDKGSVTISALAERVKDAGEGMKRISIPKDSAQSIVVAEDGTMVVIAKNVIVKPVKKA